MTKSKIARRIYNDTPKETKDMVRLYGNYLVERRKELVKQGVSFFSEAELMPLKTVTLRSKV